MKNLKLILLLQAFALGLCSLQGQDCPCEGGTADFSVDCDGDGIKDACSIDDCKPCQLDKPPSDKKECCGNKEYDPSKDTIEKKYDVKPVADFISSAFNKLPYVDGVEGGAEATIALKPCCNSAEEVENLGVGKITGSLSASASVDKTLSPLDISHTMDIKACGEVGVILDVGPYIKLGASLEAKITGTKNQCDDTEEWVASASASGKVTAGVKAEAVMVVCFVSVYGKADASVSTAVGGEFTYSNLTGGSADICYGDLKGDINAEFDVPAYGQKEFKLKKDYLFVAGNCVPVLPNE